MIDAKFQEKKMFFFKSELKRKKNTSYHCSIFYLLNAREVSKEFFQTFHERNHHIVHRDTHMRACKFFLAVIPLNILHRRYSRDR